MQRSWGVRPDETGTVTREALIAALIDAATMLDLAGGCLVVNVGRAPTDMPGEMVMTGVALTWADRTDAKPQPEQARDVTPTPAEREATVAAIDALREEPDVDPEAAALAEVRSESGEPDGFDYDSLEEEDISDPAGVAS